MKFGGKRTVRREWLYATASALALIQATPAWAQGGPPQIAQAQQTYRFNIAAKPLPQAIADFSSVTGVQVLYTERSTFGHAAPALRGDYTTEQALRHLLAGSGLTWRYTAANAVTVEKVQAGGATTLDPVSVEGSRQSDVPPAYDPVQGYRATQSNTLTRAPATIVETPNSVSVVTKDVIRDRDARTLDDMIDMVAGATRGGAGRGFYENVLLRGFREGNEPSSNIRENGLAMGAGYPADRAIVERLEVIKGPSAITGGRVTPGGFVNRVLKSPVYEDHVLAGAAVDSFGTARGDIDVNWGPIQGGPARARIVGAVEGGDKFVDRTEERHVALLPSVAADIGDDTRVTVTGNLFHAEGVPYAGTPVFADGTIPDVPPSRNFGGSGAEFEVQHASLSIEAVHDFLDDLSLTMRGGTKRTVTDFIDIYGYNLQTNGNATIYAGRRRREMTGYTGDVFLTKSFDLSSEESTVTLGTDYTSQSEEFHSGSTTMGTGNIFTNYDNFAVPANFGYGQDPLGNRFADLDQLGVYAQTVLRPFERLTVTGGGRFDHAIMMQSDRGQGTVNDSTEDAMTWRLGSSYELGAGVSIYGSYAESFNPQPFSFTKAGTFVAPEEAVQYETGVKSELFDKKLLLTGSVFRIIRQNVAATDPTDTNFSIAVGEQQHDGVELEAFGSVMPGLNVSAALTFMDTEVTESTSAAGAPVVGTHAAGVPKRQANLWASYEIQSGDWKGWGAGAGIIFKDGAYARVNNQIPIKGYTRTDMSIFYNGFENVDLRLNVENLFDETYIQNPSGRNYNQFGESLNVTLSLDVKF